MEGRSTATSGWGLKSRLKGRLTCSATERGVRSFRLEALPDDLLYVIVGLLDITDIRILRLVSKGLRAVATTRITHLAYDARPSWGAPLQFQVFALPHLKTLHCTFRAAHLNYFELLNQLQVAKSIDLDLTTGDALHYHCDLANKPCNGLTGLTLRFSRFSSLLPLSHYTQLRRLELRPSLEASDWPNNRVLHAMLSLTGLTELKLVDPIYGPPGPLDVALPQLQKFANLQVLSGVRIQSGDQLANLVALTTLTHVEFKIRRAEVAASQLTSLSMVRQLAIEFQTGSQDSSVVCGELVAAMKCLTQLKNLSLTRYDQLGQLGSSLCNLTSLTLSSKVRYHDYLSELAKFNLAKLVSLSLRLYQDASVTRNARSSWSVLLAATQLEHLLLDVHGHVRGDCDTMMYHEDMLQELSCLTTLTHLKLVLNGLPSVEMERWAIRKIAKLTRLSSLSLANIPNISFRTIKWLLPLTSLTELRMNNFYDTTDKGIECLTGLTNLAVVGYPNTLCPRHTEMLRPLMEFQYKRGMRVVNSCYDKVTGPM